LGTKSCEKSTLLSAVSGTRSGSVEVRVRAKDRVRVGLRLAKNLKQPWP